MVVGFQPGVKGPDGIGGQTMASPAQILSIIIPAANEAALIGGCLGALAASDPVPCRVEVIVVANGCRDDTVTQAEQSAGALRVRGWAVRVLDLPQGGKIGALNAGDLAAQGTLRAYLDADVTVSPGLLPALVTALDRAAPTYASGQVRITGRTFVARAYARLWTRVPFMAQGVPGCGLFAVNAAGRARWADFPAIISDDTFVRLQFAPGERVSAPAPYDWPIAESFGALVRVRRRQDRGVAEIAARFPDLPARDGTPRLGLSGAARLAVADPVGFAVYAAVALATRLSRGEQGWERSR
jgi:glycosyltransferase involved in cell wall biosynthesis